MNRKWICIGLLILPTALLLLCLSGCSPPTPPPSAGPPRLGTLIDITGTVQVRSGNAGAFAMAGLDRAWNVADQLSTGADGSARLLLADGIYLRAGPNTLLVNQSSPDEWQFILERGALGATLFGRHITVVTPLGQVSVSGTAVAFKYDPGQPDVTTDDVWTIQCLRGTCQFQDDTRSISLQDLGQLTICAGGTKVVQSLASSAAVNEFLANDPEAAGLLINQQAAAPAPSATLLATFEPTAIASGTLNAAVSTAPGTATSTPTLTPTATPTTTSTATPTLTVTQTVTRTPRPTPKYVPPTITPVPPTNTPQPTASGGGGSGGGGGGGGGSGGGGQPPQPPQPPPHRTAPPPKPA